MKKEKVKKNVVKEGEKVIKMANKKEVYRAILTDIFAEEIRDGYVEFQCEYLLSADGRDAWFFNDHFDGDRFNFKANTFFEFLKTNGIQYVNYEELAGLTFEAELHVDSRFNKVLIPTKLLALPLAMRN